MFLKLRIKTLICWATRNFEQTFIFKSVFYLIKRSIKLSVLVNTFFLFQKTLKEWEKSDGFLLVLNNIGSLGLEIKQVSWYHFILLHCYIQLWKPFYEFIVYILYISAILQLLLKNNLIFFIKMHVICITDTSLCKMILFFHIRK